MLQLRSMKALKFYPFHPELPVAPFVDDSINPYFGRASKVLLPTEADVQRLREERAQQVIVCLFVLLF